MQYLAHLRLCIVGLDWAFPAFSSRNVVFGIKMYVVHYNVNAAASLPFITTADYYQKIFQLIQFIS